jgi:hypothetical protein
MPAAVGAGVVGQDEREQEVIIELGGVISREARRGHPDANVGRYWTVADNRELPRFAVRSGTRRARLRSNRGLASSRGATAGA